MQGAFIQKSRINSVMTLTEEMSPAFRNEDRNKIFVFPYKIITGVLIMTEAGLKPINSIPNDFTTYSESLSGREAITTEWLGAVDNVQIKDDTDPRNTDKNYWEKTFQVGNRFEGVIISNTVSEQVTTSGFNVGMKSLNIARTVEVAFRKQEGEQFDLNDFTNDLIENTKKYVFNLFEIPELEIEEEKNNVKEEVYPRESDFSKETGAFSKRNVFYSEDRQWLRLDSADIYYNWKEGQKNIYQVIVKFVSVNDLFANSNLAINQFIQWGAPGDKYARPVVDPVTRAITLDKSALTPAPITHVEVMFFGTAGKTSIVLSGREVELNDNSNVEKIKSSKWLFPNKYQAPSYFQGKNTGIAYNNYYAIQGCESVIDTYFDSWMSRFKQSMYDELTVKRLEGHWRTAQTESEATNPSMSSDTTPIPQDQLVYWDSDFLKNDAAWLSTSYGHADNAKGQKYDLNYFNVATNPYFTADPQATFKKSNLPNNLGIQIDPATGDTPFKFSDVPAANRSLSTWNMFNFFGYNSIVEVPISIRQTTPITFNVNGFFSAFSLGKFALPIMNFGLKVGFKDVATTNVPKIPWYNMLLPTDLYESWCNTLYAFPDNSNNFPASIKGKGIMPYDCLKSGTADTLNEILGTNAGNTSFLFNLTDQIEIEATALDNTKLPLTTIDTRELQQYNFSDNSLDNPTSVNLVTAKTKLKPPIPTQIGWAIDCINIKCLASCDYMINFYSKPTDYDGSVDDRFCVWSGMFQTFGKATGNQRLWNNTLLLGNPFYDENALPYLYPQDVQTPDATNANKFTRTIPDFSLKTKVEVGADWKIGVLSDNFAAIATVPPFSPGSSNSGEIYPIQQATINKITFDASISFKSPALFAFPVEVLGVTPPFPIKEVKILETVNSKVNNTILSGQTIDLKSLIGGGLFDGNTNEPTETTFGDSTVSLLQDSSSTLQLAWDTNQSALVLSSTDLQWGYEGQFKGSAEQIKAGNAIAEMDLSIDISNIVVYYER